MVKKNPFLKEVKNNGGEAILTSSNHKSGSDRIFEAFTKLKINNVDYLSLIHI